MRILGIESSCDETSAAVIEDGRRLLSNVVNSQIDIHAVYGGVVPEVAARSHLEVILPVIQKALDDSSSTWDDIDAIAVTYAPGLVGSLLIGSLAARTLALLKNKPLIPVHHVEGHVYANFIVEEGLTPPLDSEINSPSSPHPLKLAQSARDLPHMQPKFPILALIVSGGHSQLVLFRGHGDYELLGQTQDDAVGEAFDKVAKIIGLPYPGGPSVAKAAENGDSKAYEFPKAKLQCPPGCTHTLAGRADDGSQNNLQPKTDQADLQSEQQPLSGLARSRSDESLSAKSGRQSCMRYSFSFSGLKTAVLRAVQREVGVDHTFPSTQLAARLNASQRDNFAASFQRIAVETLVGKTLKAYHDHSPASVVIAGGVAANQELRRQLRETLPIPIEYAPMNLCTDNAAMIGALGYYMFEAGLARDPRDIEVVPSLSMTKTSWAPTTLINN